MSDRLYVATRKGVFTIERRKGRPRARWAITRADFLADNASVVLPDRREGAVYVALGHGHFGVKLHRSRNRGRQWEPCATPAYPPKPEGIEDREPNSGKPIPWSTELVWALEAGHDTEPGTLWCGTLPGGLFRSQDRAVTAQDYVDQVVERARKEFDVPGIAVAIVKDGKVVHAKGYGVRKIGQPAPVTTETLFRIASNTKAFTSAALAILVDEKRIAWDDPVVQHLPAFQMYDPYVTREMTIRDLLTHRSGLGLGAGDLMFFPPSDLPPAEIVRRLRFIKPATSFRSAYAYDNLLYLVAGSIIPAVTGKNWRFLEGAYLRSAGNGPHVHRYHELPRGEKFGDAAQQALRQTGSANI